MHIAFYAISTMDSPGRQDGNCSAPRLGIDPCCHRGLCAWAFCTALLRSATSLGLLLPQANLGFQKHIFFPEWDKPWNRTDLWCAKLLTQQDKKQTEERNIFTKGCREKVSIAALLIGIEKIPNQIDKVFVTWISHIWGHPSTQN